MAQSQPRLPAPIARIAFCISMLPFDLPLSWNPLYDDADRAAHFVYEKSKTCETYRCF